MSDFPFWAGTVVLVLFCGYMLSLFISIFRGPKMLDASGVAEARKELGLPDEEPVLSEALIAMLEAEDKENLKKWQAVLAGIGFPPDAEPMAEIIARTKTGALAWRMVNNHPYLIVFEADLSPEIQVKAECTRMEFRREAPEPPHVIVCYSLRIDCGHSRPRHYFHFYDQASDHHREAREFVEYLANWFNVEIPQPV